MGNMNFLEYYKKTDYNSMKQTILHNIVKHIELEAQFNIWDFKAFNCLDFCLDNNIKDEILSFLVSIYRIGACKTILEDSRTRTIESLDIYERDIFIKLYFGLTEKFINLNFRPQDYKYEHEKQKEIDNDRIQEALIMLNEIATLLCEYEIKE